MHFLSTYLCIQICPKGYVNYIYHIQELKIEDMTTPYKTVKNNNQALNLTLK